MFDLLEDHYKTVIRAITEGRVVPFLGAGVNLCCRPQGKAYRPGQREFLPSGTELAGYLADEFGCEGGNKNDLLRVSQHVAVMQGSGPLYDELHQVFDADYPPTLLHEFLAELPAILERKGYPKRYQLVVTTNYDDLLERAFRAADEPFDLVTYVVEGDHRGKFLHWLPDGQERLIDKPNEYLGLSLNRQTVVLKIHGTVDRRESAEQDSFVITEDHYIDYLTRTDISNLVPVTLAAKLRKSHFLFLGYSLRDWNLRVILHRIWGEQKLTYKSWAILLNPETIDEKFWVKRDVDMINVPLEKYIKGLKERIDALPDTGDIS